MSRGSFYPQHCVSRFIISPTLCLEVHFIPNIVFIGTSYPHHCVSRFISSPTLCIYQLEFIPNTVSLRTFHPKHYVSTYIPSPTLCLYVHSIPNIMSLGIFHPLPRPYYPLSLPPSDLTTSCPCLPQTLLPPVLASLRPYYRDPYGRDRTGGQVQLMIDYQRHVPTPAAQASCTGSTKSPRLQQLRETMDEAAARR